MSDKRHVKINDEVSAWLNDEDNIHIRAMSRHADDPAELTEEELGRLIAGLLSLRDIVAADENT